MEYKLVKQLKDDDKLRKSFMELAAETFDLSFEAWYQNGFWTDRYIPYALTEADTVIANASVNIIDTRWRGRPRRFLQLGTVMTRSAYRRRGLARTLLAEILADWKENCDGIYLYANETVLDFYPTFGFEKAVEYQYSLPVCPRPGDFQKLDMDDNYSRELLKRCYLKSNPFSELSFVDNYGLLMFYCADFMKDCVYYSAKRDTICVAQQDEDSFTCFDIFGTPSANLTTLLDELSPPQTRQVALGFTPAAKNECACHLAEEDIHLFVLSGKENIFRENRIMMPALSHA